MYSVGSMDGDLVLKNSELYDYAADDIESGVGGIKL
jgi:hypothetical protein